MISAEPKLRQWTRSEYMKMAEVGIFAPDEQIELIEGKIIEMSPQNTSHAVVVSLISEALRIIFGENYYVRIQMPIEINGISEPEPDVVVVSGTPRDYLSRHPTTAILIVEVSDSTLAYDRNQKTSLYAKAEIEDYWIVNLINRRLEVYREPGLMKDQPFGFGYKQITYYSETDSVSPIVLPQSSIAVEGILP
ncbi:Uma2 family endonuclease [bacterium]|nr:Uma2 family endonuclease [bacterium]